MAKVNEKKNDSKQVIKQHDINYLVIKSSDSISLATKVNDYLENFKHFVPLGGICFVNDNGENYFCQAMYNKERNLNG